MLICGGLSVFSCLPNLIQEIRFRFASSVTQDTVGLFPSLRGVSFVALWFFGALLLLKILCDLPRSATFGSQKHG